MSVPWIERFGAFRDLGPLAFGLTGRRLIGTDGGLYTFSDTEVRVPDGDVEAVIHELCHWTVADDSERRQVNHGCSTDWTHPRFTRMVKCEELAWSLETYLFGDPSVQAMQACMTPEAVSSGGGYYGGHSDWTSYTDYGPKPKTEPTAQAEVSVARKTVIKHGELRPEGTEDLRREALRKAEAVRLPVKELRALIERAYGTKTESLFHVRAIEASLDALCLDPGKKRVERDDSLESCWADLRPKGTLTKQTPVAAKQTPVENRKVCYINGAWTRTLTECGELASGVRWTSEPSDEVTCPNCRRLINDVSR